MNFLRLVIQQPVTVAVGVILIIMAGVLTLQRTPISLTPQVDDTIIAVTTVWEGASPIEIEREIIEEQEDKLQGVANVRSMTSESQQGVGSIRLEFTVGTLKEVALREVSDKLRQVPDYPANVDEPTVVASDPENRDFIAWMVFSTTDPNFDVLTLQEFAEDRIKQALERIDGMSEVNVLGGREREAQVRFNPVLLAKYGISPTDFRQAIRDTNRNVSGGRLPDGKSNVRLRMVGEFESIEDVYETVIKRTDAGPIYVRDVADVVVAYKELGDFVRSKGRPVIAINAQKDVGANVIEVMGKLRTVLDRLNGPGGVLKTHARSLGLDGTLEIELAYDQTVYIDDALALVRTNIWFGGGLAIMVLLLFLRSLRSMGIIAVAIPISVVGAVATMIAMGRSVNVISLAGMAFAVGMVVDNAIVVLENIFRHLEMGKKPARAAYDGAREVWGAVLASTLTTLVVFIPILLVQEEAGQLFRDIALAICAAVGLSLIVSITVIPTVAARVFSQVEEKPAPSRTHSNFAHAALVQSGRVLHAIPERIGDFIHWICGSVLARIAVVALLTVASIAGTVMLMPDSDYLPSGNRNIVFGLLLPPPGYNQEQMESLAKRVEKTIAPHWEAAEHEVGTEAYEEAAANLPKVTDWWDKDQRRVVPPPIENYFAVSVEGTMFHGGVATEPSRAVDIRPLFDHASRSEVLPGVNAYAFQVPLFSLGGSTGSAIKINLSGDDLDRVSSAAGKLKVALEAQFGRRAVQPSPSNFNIHGPEIQVVPNKRRLADLGLTPADLGLAAQMSGDGSIVGEYRLGGESIDLKLIDAKSVDRTAIVRLEDTPIAAPTGHVVPLDSVADFRRVTSPPQINHVERRRSVTLLLSPNDIPLEQAVDDVSEILAGMRADGVIPPDISSSFTGSASKLESVKTALLGDGSLLSTLGSSLFLALLVVYLMMCVLFQSFIRPLVIMFSVPLATVGGFIALKIVANLSEASPYVPDQKLDVLTMLGFVILIGVVVNNAILIVHQAGHFMDGKASSADGTMEKMAPRKAIAQAVRTRVRPIFMSTFTSIGGMAPLVLMPGAGSELYRGLGGVVLGGLLVSTIFTILLVPLLLSLVMDAQSWMGRAFRTNPSEIAIHEPVAAPAAE